MDATFSRQHRLTNQQDFAFVFASPIRIAQQCLLSLCRHNNKMYARLGIIIKKQVIRQAAKRALIRRLLRESFRQNKHLLAGVDIVILLKPIDQHFTQYSLRKMVDNLWLAIAKRCT